MHAFGFFHEIKEALISVACSLAEWTDQHRHGIVPLLSRWFGNVIRDGHADTIDFQHLHFDLKAASLAHSFLPPIQVKPYNVQPGHPAQRTTPTWYVNVETSP